VTSNNLDFALLRGPTHFEKPSLGIAPPKEPYREKERFFYSAFFPKGALAGSVAFRRTLGSVRHRLAFFCGQNFSRAAISFAAFSVFCRTFPTGSGLGNPCRWCFTLASPPQYTQAAVVDLGCDTKNCASKTPRSDMICHGDCPRLPPANARRARFGDLSDVIDGTEDIPIFQSFQRKMGLSEGQNCSPPKVRPFERARVAELQGVFKYKVPELVSRASSEYDLFSRTLKNPLRSHLPNGASPERARDSSSMFPDRHFFHDNPRPCVLSGLLSGLWRIRFLDT